MNTQAIIATSLMMSMVGVGANLPEIYPVPQQMQLDAAKMVVPQRGQIITRTKAQNSSALDGVQAKSGAYKIVVKPDGVVDIAAHDERGVFYAKQTLAQMMQGGKLQLPVGSITDWPDIEYRGTVEGFYGTPWSHASRIEQIKFYGKNKMNTYIYGPKDDPYHSSPHWRNAYPPKEEAQIRELVAEAKKNHVDFVWAIHPGKDIKWTEEDMKNVLNKFDMMYSLGVRAFAVFFDDISGAGTKAEKQAELLNMIHHDFIEAKGDVIPLVMCPTEYNKGWANRQPGSYLDVLGDKLHPSIHVMWTGDSVCHDISKESQDWVNARVKRPTYVWWNFPVTDYVRDHLCMGRVYGLPTGEGEAATMGGFVSNPMDKPEASKVPLFSVGDYAWNTRAFDSAKSWQAGVKRLFPHCAVAMQTFVNHNSDMGPNGHGYRRAESEEIKPIIDCMLAGGTSHGKSQLEDFDTVKREFDQITKAVHEIKSKCNNPALLTEITPWLDAFEQLGMAGTSTMKSVYEATNADERLQGLVSATAALAKMDVVGARARGKEQYQPGVKVGSLVLAPFISTLLDKTAALLQTEMFPLAATTTRGPQATASASSTSAQLKSLSVKQTDKIIGINPVLEVATLKPGETITMELAAPVDPTWLEINLDDPKLKQWSEVFVKVGDNLVPQEVYQEGHKLIAKSPSLPKDVTGLVLKNKSNSDQAGRLQMFKFDVPRANPAKNVAAMSDSQLRTYYLVDAPLDVVLKNPKGNDAQKVTVVGNALYAISVQNASGAWQELGKRADAKTKAWTLPTGTRAVRLYYGKPQEAVINEVVWE